MRAIDWLDERLHAIYDAAPGRVQLILYAILLLVVVLVTRDHHF